MDRKEEIKEERGRQGVAVGALRQAHSPTAKIYIPMVVDGDKAASFTPHLYCRSCSHICGTYIIKNMQNSVSNIVFH